MPNRINPVSGFLTTITPQRLKGFVFDSSKEKISLTLLLNGNKLGEIDAKPLPDDAKESPRLLFDIPLASFGIFHKEDHLSASYKGISLLPSPALAQKQYIAQKIKESEQHKILIIHIPKTGGTSLRFLLQSQFGSQQLFPSAQDLKKNGGSYYAAKDLKIKVKEDKHKIYMGHYKMNTQRIFEHKPTMICYLRNPLTQMISLAKHFKNYRKDCSSLSIEDILLNVLPNNPQTRFFLPPRLPEHTFTSEDLSIAKNMLLSIDYFGIFEHLEVSTKNLQSFFNIPHKKMNWENKSKIANDYKELYPLIKAKILTDLKFYDFALKTFEKKYME